MATAGGYGHGALRAVAWIHADRCWPKGPTVHPFLRIARFRAVAWIHADRCWPRGPHRRTQINEPIRRAVPDSGTAASSPQGRTRWQSIMRRDLKPRRLSDQPSRQGTGRVRNVGCTHQRGNSVSTSPRDIGRTRACLASGPPTRGRSADRCQRAPHRHRSPSP